MIPESPRPTREDAERKLAKICRLLDQLALFEKGGVWSPVWQARKERLEKMKALIERSMLASLPPETDSGRRVSPELRTPSWISEHVTAHGGGWFYPVRVPDGHPAVGRPCDACGDSIAAGDTVFVMPFHGEGESRWLVQHRLCTAKQLFGPNAEGVLEAYRDRGSKHALFELARFRFDEHAAGCDTCRASHVTIIKVDRQLPLGVAHEAPAASFMGNTEALCPEGAKILIEVRATTDRTR